MGYRREVIGNKDKLEKKGLSILLDIILLRDLSFIVDLSCLGYIPFRSTMQRWMESCENLTLFFCVFDLVDKSWVIGGKRL